ncbi:ATP-dependent DNA helicase PIF2-like [Galendromus occidentalis]|uniref:ATP-dependent DNA helicase n=1 Tax=Galendromus occidentalis TaxID=34638 RepID=A0AAJ7L4H4_9ACAR|nr:ATP-dependent DNA helicase PIF2-like [Galendromus occidentalis]
MAVRGTTVHHAFNICTMQRRGGLSFEQIQLYRSAFADIRIVFIDEISMIGAGIFHTINERLKNITMQHDVPFGGMDIIFSGDLRQLPPVCMKPIYEPLTRGIHRSVLWQSLEYYPLNHVMRQADSQFSSILTKTGDGVPLASDEQRLIESRFRTREWCEEHAHSAIRLFHRNNQVEAYNTSVVTPKWVAVATDIYSGHRDNAQLSLSRSNVHKMSPAETGNLLYHIPLE